MGEIMKVQGRCHCGQISYEAEIDRAARAARVGWCQGFDTAEHRDQIAPFVEKANEQNLDRLAAVVREAWPLIAPARPVPRR